MDRVFSVEELADHFWSSPPPIRQSGTEPPNMNRSSSEWAFQRFLQEAASSSSSSAAAVAAPPVEVVVNGENDNDVIEIKDQVQQHLNPNPKKNPNSHSGDPKTPPLNAPSNIPIDSEEYLAFLKSRLNLACAAVALSRVIFLLLFLGVLPFGLYLFVGKMEGNDEKRWENEILNDYMFHICYAKLAGDFFFSETKQKLRSKSHTCRYFFLQNKLTFPFFSYIPFFPIYHFTSHQEFPIKKC